MAVLRLTGLIRSYTLECNYNTGRFVNKLPQCSRDLPGKNNSNLIVPPKYSPGVYEEVKTKSKNKAKNKIFNVHTLPANCFLSRRALWGSDMSMILKILNYKTKTLSKMAIFILEADRS